MLAAGIDGVPYAFSFCLMSRSSGEVTTTEVTTTEVTTTSTNTSVTTMETSTTPGITTIPSNQSEGSVTTTPSTEPTDDGGYLVET